MVKINSASTKTVPNGKEEDRWQCQDDHQFSLFHTSLSLWSIHFLTHESSLGYILHKVFLD